MPAIDNDLPKNCKDLNAWIRINFNVLETSRAYVMFPFQAYVGAPGGKPTQFNVRAIMLSLGFEGDEENCCMALAAHIQACISLEEWQDQCVTLFLRRPFEVGKDDFQEGKSYVSGRLAFWEVDKNEKLASSPAMKLEGMLSRPWRMPTGWLDFHFRNRI